MGCQGRTIFNFYARRQDIKYLHVICPILLLWYNGGFSYLLDADLSYLFQLRS